jgi:hypothetical protein
MRDERRFACGNTAAPAMVAAGGRMRSTSPIHSWLATVALAFALNAGAQTPTEAPAAGTSTPAEKAGDKTNGESGGDDGRTGGSENFFAGWSVGLAVIKPKQASLSDATIINGIVRVNARASQEASLLVSRQFYLFSDGSRCAPAATNEGRADKVEGRTGMNRALNTLGRCVGVMVGVGLGATGSAGSTQLINFAGAGLTIGSGVDKVGKTNWHFGFGIGRKFNAKVLGDGFTADAPPPPDETQVRYKTIDTQAKFIYFSTSL